MPRTRKCPSGWGSAPLALVALALPTAASAATVVVREPAGLARRSATVEIPWAKVSLADPARVQVRSDGRSLVAQVLDDDGDGKPDLLLVQLDLAADATQQMEIVAGDPAQPPPPRVTARLVSERPDLAWESDLIAFRIYQSDLKNTSGIDVWTKKVATPVTTSWYRRGNYHADQGEGCDAYNVGNGRGCGGMGIWHAGALHVGVGYAEGRILATGPIRAQFEVRYAPWLVGEDRIGETKRIAIDAGQRFCVLRSVLTSERGAASATIAIGVQCHAGGIATMRSEQGWAAVWETLGSHGQIGCAALIDPSHAARLIEAKGHLLILTEVRFGETISYRAGAAWDRSGAVADGEGWNAMVAQAAREAANPLSIAIAP